MKNIFIIFSIFSLFINCSKLDKFNFETDLQGIWMDQEDSLNTELYIFIPNNEKEGMLQTTTVYTNDLEEILEIISLPSLYFDKIYSYKISSSSEICLFEPIVEIYENDMNTRQKNCLSYIIIPKNKSEILLSSIKSIQSIKLKKIQNNTNVNYIIPNWLI